MTGSAAALDLLLVQHPPTACCCLPVLGVPRPPSPGLRRAESAPPLSNPSLLHPFPSLLPPFRPPAFSSQLPAGVAAPRMGLGPCPWREHSLPSLCQVKQARTGGSFKAGNDPHTAEPWARGLIGRLPVLDRKADSLCKQKEKQLKTAAVATYWQNLENQAEFQSSVSSL